MIGTLSLTNGGLKGKETSKIIAPSPCPLLPLGKILGFEQLPNFH